jgi:hypothetical protein
MVVVFLRFVPWVAAGLAFLGGLGEARAESFELALVVDPWANEPSPRVRTRHWWMPTSEIIDPWQSSARERTVRAEFEIVDPWARRVRRVPTASFRGSR